MKSKPICLLCCFLCSCSLQVMSQTGMIKGIVQSDGKKLGAVTVTLNRPASRIITNEKGEFFFQNLPYGTYELSFSSMGYESQKKRHKVAQDTMSVSVEMAPSSVALEEVVVTGTMKLTSRLQSPVPVEVYSAQMFTKNPTASLSEAVCMINGIRPQINCNVCNTSDIRVNGMEGPYTMILIDGIPIVSALSAVYGLTGIPNSIIERLEVVKGPGSSLYGSEAMGGIINVITKDPQKAPLISADAFATSWKEYNMDLSAKFKAGKATSLLGISYFNYRNPKDNNKDGFTDLTLQNRISVFNKWNFHRSHDRVARLAARYVYEDRWGGQMDWNTAWRGSDSIYGESIYTKRLEVIGMYQLPAAEKIMLQLSYNSHDQNSFYGNTPYMARQNVAFLQAYWDKQLHKRHSLLLGASFRYTYYDDNTPGTLSADGLKNMAAETPLPGIFLQDEYTISEDQTLLAGYRYDYDRRHGGVHSPRLAYKWTMDNRHTLRISLGTGYRVVNLFTEDHAALTGSREVVIQEALKPERSCNANLNYVWKLNAGKTNINIDLTAYYSYFTNKITGDFDADPNKIIYHNLNGHAVSRGLSLNTDISFSFPLKITVGGSYMDVFRVENTSTSVKEKIIQLFAPVWSGTFMAGYTFPGNFHLDLTGNWNGPMRLPLQQNDYRPGYSPFFLLANLQIVKKLSHDVEIYSGIKNLFNYVPRYALMRSFDPFDRTVLDPVSNPQGYTFDTEYNYAPLQGIRFFTGVRFRLD